MLRPPEPRISTLRNFCSRKKCVFSGARSGVSTPRTLSMKRLNRKRVSSGPAEASGWNCDEKIFFVRWMMPSFE